MGKGRFIGSDIREALDWAQENLRTTRPLAEQTMLSAFHSQKMVWDDGIYLLEDDEELERRQRASVQSSQKSLNVAKRWSRIHFRNSNRNNGKNSLASVHKQGASKFSDAAEEMINQKSLAALPSSSKVEEDKK